VQSTFHISVLVEDDCFLLKQAKNGS